MRYISADYIFTINTEPIKNGVITIDDVGEIIAIDTAKDKQQPTADIEYYEGIICPGFINTHCHLELSHLREQITENTGMTGFIRELISKRFDFSEQLITNAIDIAEQEMMKNGIVAVGDIANNDSTFRQKAKGNLRYHTFIELFNMDNDKAEETMNKGFDLKEELLKLETLNFNPSVSITPHAPYTMSVSLLKLMEQYAVETNSSISIHNQESEGENELFISKSGVMFETFKAMGINTDLIRQTGLNALQSTLPYIINAKKILLVHNTFTTVEDIKFIKSQTSNFNSHIYFCTCPNANIYIENKLPDYNLLISENCTITIGTDSLASNWGLSVVEEMKMISIHFPNISLQTLLTWATKNGAEFLGLPQLGTIEKGKKPGLNLITNLERLKLTNRSQVIRLV